MEELQRDCDPDFIEVQWTNRLSSDSRIRNPLYGSHSGGAANEWRVVQLGNSARHQMRIGSVCPRQCVHCMGNWTGSFQNPEKEQNERGANLKNPESSLVRYLSTLAS